MICLVWGTSVGAMAEEPVVLPSVSPPVSLSVAKGKAVASVEPSSVRTPEGVVEALHDILIECMKRADELGFEGRYGLIVETLDETFDLPLMARTSIARAWKELGREEQRAWLGLSRRYSASNYANQFDGYSGQHFATLKKEPAARGTIKVFTELVQPSDDNVQLDYRLREVDGEWRIIDVHLDGKVSELTLRRADYRAVIERRGFDDLVKEVTEKVERFADE
jgi:phospholipid transport system substrate-binding protein